MQSLLVGVTLPGNCIYQQQRLFAGASKCSKSAWTQLWPFKLEENMASKHYLQKLLGILCKEQKLHAILYATDWLSVEDLRELLLSTKRQSSL